MYWFFGGFFSLSRFDPKLKCVSFLTYNIFLNYMYYLGKKRVSYYISFFYIIFFLPFDRALSIKEIDIV